MEKLYASAARAIEQSGLLDIEDPRSHALWQLMLDALANRPSASAGVVDGDESSLSEDEADPAQLSNKQPEQASNPLAALPNAEAVAEYLLKELKEQQNPGLKTRFRKAAENLGAEELYKVLLSTGKAIRDNEPILVDTHGKKRTAGGVFLQRLKQAEANAKLVRSQEKDVKGGESTFQLRSYQIKAVRAIQSSSPARKNWIVAAPTNSGKTAIFITVARDLIASKPQAKIVLVVPTISLLLQQAVAFERAGGFCMAMTAKSKNACLPEVDYFCGEKPFPAGHSTWNDELQHLSVLVFEANTLLNLLRANRATSARAHVKDIDLLILDECHHCNKSHPYAEIMDYVSASMTKPQVLGFSASPANASTNDGFAKELKILCQTMGDAQLHVVDENDPDVREVAPAPTEHESFCPVRSLDTDLAALIKQQMFALALDLGSALRSAANSATASRAVDGFVAQIPSAALVWQNHLHAYNLLCYWLRMSIQLATSKRLVQFGIGVELLDALRKGAALCEDMGYECGLCFVLQVLVVKALKAQRCARAPSEEPPLKQARAASSAGHALGVHAGAEVSSSSAAAAAAAAASQPKTGAGGGDQEQQELAALRAYVQHGPCPAEKQAAQGAKATAAFASRTGFDLLLDSEPCEDIGGDIVLHMAQRFLQKLQAYADMGGPEPFCFSSGSGSGCLSAAVIRPFLPGGLLPPPATFFKLWELLKCLEEYSSSDNFHAIIFTRTRQGAHHLASALQSAMQPPQSSAAASASAPHSSSSSSSSSAAGPHKGRLRLRPAGVHVLVGHGEANTNTKRLPHDLTLARAGGGDGGSAHDLADQQSHHHGMSVTRQRAVVDAFKASGRKLLVATNAAEEGLDVPSCELVVRFSPATTGIQRVQARGRGRKANARYVCLIQNDGLGLGGGSDSALHIKSKQEESILRQGLIGNKHLM